MPPALRPAGGAGASRDGATRTGAAGQVLIRTAAAGVNFASGGVGSFAVQIARTMGARVTATCSGRNADLARRLGADEVSDYAQADVTAGGSPCGVVVTTKPALGNRVSRWLSHATGGGRRSGRRFESVFVRPSGEDLQTVGVWIPAGRVKPVVDRTYPLSDAAEAQR